MYSRIGPSNPWVQVTSPGWLEACQSERCPHDRIHLSRSIELRFRFKSDTSVKLRVFQACQFVILPAACSCFFSTVECDRCQRSQHANFRCCRQHQVLYPLMRRFRPSATPSSRWIWYHVVICGKNEHSMSTDASTNIKMIRWIGFPVYYQPKTCL